MGSIFKVLGSARAVMLGVLVFGLATTFFRTSAPVASPFVPEAEQKWLAIADVVGVLAIESPSELEQIEQSFRSSKIDFGSVPLLWFWLEEEPQGERIEALYPLKIWSESDFAYTTYSRPASVLHPEQRVARALLAPFVSALYGPDLVIKQPKELLSSMGLEPVENNMHQLVKVYGPIKYLKEDSNEGMTVAVGISFFSEGRQVCYFYQRREEMENGRIVRFGGTGPLNCKEYLWTQMTPWFKFDELIASE